MRRLEAELRRECTKLINRFERYARELRDDDKRRTRRTGVAHQATLYRPGYWDADAAFNPYRVRSQATSIARSLELALAKHDYRPFNPVKYDVAKPDGSSRPVSVFTVADTLVSTRVYRSLLQKNRSLLSSYSYAYRDDLSVHDAILHISADMRTNSRVFIAEYDFSKYFESISHDYVWRVLRDNRFLVSPLEEQVVNAFLATESQDVNGYTSHTKASNGKTGLPQGTSISLFLANVAAWELDRALERIGVGFARYADDTLIWSDDYGRINAAASALNDISAEIGTRINFKKSDGISVFNPTGAATEMKSKDVAEFVGYRLSRSGVGMSESAVERAKSRMAYIIWSNLLEPLKQGHYVPSRFAPSVDRDYVVMIFQLRRYLYGDLTERKLSKLYNGKSRKVNYQGLMSFYPLLDDFEQLKELDGWLQHTVLTSIRKRGTLLTNLGAVHLPTPHGLSRQELLRAQGRTTRGDHLDLSLPSFVRMGRVIRRAVEFHGPRVVTRSGRNDYVYQR